MPAESPDAAHPGAGGDADDGAPTPEAIEAGRRLFAQDCDFLGAAVATDRLPVTDLPEVAFAGRSNVGKSSLINALTGRKTLARISQAPGRTRQINFFDLGGRLILVDLPGYGYARAAKADIRRWRALTRRYLRGRPALRRVCLLIDARHGAKDSDREIMAELDQAAVSYQAVLTKADKVKPAAFAAVLDALRRELAHHPAAHPDCPPTSARSGLGIPELRAALAALAAPAQRG
jgi:GTP-binding protein